MFAAPSSSPCVNVQCSQGVKARRKSHCPPSRVSNFALRQCSTHSTVSLKEKFSRSRISCSASTVQLNGVGSDNLHALAVQTNLRPCPAELARTLTAACSEGTLATVSVDGWPLATTVQFSLDAEGRPVLRLSPEALHTQNLESNNSCCLHVQLELPGKQKPQCTLKGHLHQPSDDDSKFKLETAWRRRYDVADDTKAGTFYWIEIDSVLVTQDLGEEEVWVPAGDYSISTPDPLRDQAAKIVEDVNRLHWEDVRRFCYSYAEISEEIEEASMTWVDKYGIDVRVLIRDSQQLREVRIPFKRLVTDERDARSSIMMMAQTAWEIERNYIPPEIPLVGSQDII